MSDLEVGLVISVIAGISTIIFNRGIDRMILQIKEKVN